MNYSNIQKTKEFIRILMKTQSFYVEHMIYKYFCTKDESILHNVLMELYYYDDHKYISKQWHDKYIKSEAWQNRRHQYLERILKRENSIKCKICSLVLDVSSVNLHHRDYTFLGTEKELEHLVCLCESCHFKLHNLISELLKIGPGSKLLQRNTAFFDKNKYIKFGKYKGLHISEIPDNYLEWVLDNTNSDEDIVLIEDYLDS